MVNASVKKRHAQERPPKKGAKPILIVIILLIICGASAFLIINMHEDTKNEVLKAGYPRKYSEYVNKAAADYNLEPALIYAVIRTESGFNAEATSYVGARGLMQMMPESFEWIAENRGQSGVCTADDLYNPEVCVDYGCYLLKYFYNLYGDERCAVAAYNAGFVVGEWLENSEYSDDGKTLTDIPYGETKEYVNRVESAKEMYIKLYY